MSDVKRYTYDAANSTRDDNLVPAADGAPNKAPWRSQ